MASEHVIALSHLVGAGVGLTLVTIAVRVLVRRPRTRVRTEDALQSKQRLRGLARLVGCLLRGTLRFVAALGLALAGPIGLLCANQRYPLVATVLAPFEARLAALGHRTGHAQCFPLLVWHIWLVRCAGCRRRSFFREVPAPGGTGVELKALGRSGWRTRRCPAEYLTARPAQAAASARSARPARRRARPSHAVATARPVPAVSPSGSRPRSTTTDKLA